MTPGAGARSNRGASYLSRVSGVGAGYRPDGSAEKPRMWLPYSTTERYLAKASSRRRLPPGGNGATFDGLPASTRVNRGATSYPRNGYQGCLSITSASSAILVEPRPEALRPGIAPGVLFSVIGAGTRESSDLFKYARPSLRHAFILVSPLFGETVDDLYREMGFFSQFRSEFFA
jgi:hypothetical protein